MPLDKSSWHRRVSVGDEKDRPLANRLEEYNAIFIQPVQEMSKSQELISDLEISKEAVWKYFRRFGIETNIMSFSSDDVVVCRDGKLRLTDKSGATSEHQVIASSGEDGKIYISDQITHSSARILVFAHELTHKCAINREHIPRFRTTNDHGEEQAISWQKSGYTSSGMFIEEQLETKPIFHGFNEAVTTEIQFRALRESLPPDVDSNDFERFATRAGGYEREREVLRYILSGVAMKMGIKNEDFWNQIVHGYVSGGKMFLRRIESTFGKESLDVLARMQPIMDRHNYQAERDVFLEYFKETTSPERRMEIAAEITSSPR